MSARAELLGPPILDVAGERYELVPGKRNALLVYLASRARSWVPRDQLTLLLWGEEPEGKARHNLRQMLYELGRSPFATAIASEDTRLRFTGESDLEAFSAACQRGNWREALTHWQGPFLSGWTMPQTPAVDDWIAETRATLATQHRAALKSRAAELERDGDLLEAANHHGEAWRADVLDEDALLQALGLLQEAGRSAASEARAYREAFDREIGLAIDDELDEVLQRAEAGTPLPERESVARPRLGPRALPAEATPFVGREAELEELVALLCDPETRLITLVGIGGSGKTRFALEATRRTAARGVSVGWASLATIDSPAEIAGTLTEAWGLTGPNAGRIDALAEHIGRDEALLVVDNAEHVLEGVRSACTELLARCPKLTLLVTSRVALEIRAETQRTMSGLEVAAAPESTASDAVEMLLACARRRHASFDAPPEDLASIARELGGLPLALELIASWAGVLSSGEMLAEVRSGLAALAGSWADLPERQQSLRVVLDSTWARLSDDARDAMLAIAPCRGGFDLSAARALGVDPSALRELLSVRLLQRSGRRFERHPLVARYALERARSAPHWQTLRSRHGEYFLHVAEAQVPAALRWEDGVVTNALGRDVANLRAALLWGAEHTDAAKVLRVMKVLDTLHKGYGVSGQPEFERAMLSVSEGPLLDHLRLAFRGRDLPLPAFDAIADEARRRGDRDLEARALFVRGVQVLYRHSDVTCAEESWRRALEVQPRSGFEADPERLLNCAATCNAIGVAVARRGGHRAARTHYLRAAALARRAGAPTLVSEWLHNLAYLDMLTGEYEQAARIAAEIERCLPAETSVVARVERSRLYGKVLERLGDIAGATAALERSLELTRGLYGELRDFHQQMAYRHLGSVALLEGDLDAAETRLEHAGDSDVTFVLRSRLAFARGDGEQASALAERAREANASYLPARLDASWHAAVVHGWYACLHLLTGDPAAGLPAARTALARAHEQRFAPEVARALVPVAALLHLDGDGERASRLFAELEHAPAADCETRRRSAHIATELGIDAAGWEHPRGLDLFDEAAALLGEPWLHGREPSARPRPRSP